MICCSFLAINSAFILICNFWAPILNRDDRRALAKAPRDMPRLSGSPLVSIHLAVHDEPADVVIATLKSFQSLRYPRFEVVILDNNTPCPATWQPVRAYCLSDARFRFFHFSGVKGAKAGALNIALELMDPAADYVAVVDADYQVVPDFLDIAVAECASNADHFVQFPQAYRGAAGASAIDRELGDYFAVYSSRASNVGAMLPTGTLSLICADTLRKVGGWPSTSVTEDAEIGMRMWRMGASGRYVNKVVGRGMLPLDLHGLRRQRYRWAAGNARTLLSHLGAGLAKWPAHGRWAVIAQLTAWLGFGAVPLLSLVVALVMLESGAATGAAWPFVERVARFDLAAMLSALAVVALVRGRIETLPVKLALLWTSSFAWLPQLWRSATPFLRTPKAATVLPVRISLDTGCSVLALALALGYAHLGHVFTGLVLACSASTLLVSPYVDRALRQAAARQVIG
jgi:cellulose synthase/poly-beta-1,6-N-acetylglucosamine synthase-like glycosyltransferase